MKLSCHVASLSLLQYSTLWNTEYHNHFTVLTFISRSFKEKKMKKEKRIAEIGDYANLERWSEGGN